MTDLSLTRGDSRNYRVTVTEGDLVTPIDLTNAIVRFGIKYNPEDPNTRALVLLATYDSEEINKSDPVNGEVLVQLQARMTASAATTAYAWDIEVDRPGSLVTNAGTVDLTSGEAIISGTGLDLSEAGIGDVITPAGATPNNQKPLAIIAVGGDGTELDPGVGNLRTDFSGFDTEAAVSIQIFRGDVKTPTNLSGTFNLLDDVVG